MQSVASIIVWAGLTLAASAATHLIHIDFTSPKVLDQYFGEPGAILGGRPDTTLPKGLQVTIRRCDKNGVGEHNLVLRLTNRSTSDRIVPISTDQTRLHKRDSADREILSITARTSKDLAAPVIGAAVLYSAPWDTQSFVVLAPNTSVDLDLLLRANQLVSDPTEPIYLFAQAYNVSSTGYVSEPAAQPALAENKLLEEDKGCVISSSLAQ